MALKPWSFGPQARRFLATSVLDGHQVGFDLWRHLAKHAEFYCRNQDTWNLALDPWLSTVQSEQVNQPQRTGGYFSCSLLAMFRESSIFAVGTFPSFLGSLLAGRFWRDLGQNTCHVFFWNQAFGSGPQNMLHPFLHKPFEV